MPLGIVYAIRNTQNGRRYVGSTIHQTRRWKDHVRDLNAGSHSNSHLQAAWNLYGESAFVFEVLEEADQEVLYERETFWTVHFAEASGIYNHSKVSTAPMLGRTHTAEAREKIRAANLGRKQSAEHIEKTRSALIGRPCSPETRARIGAANKGRPRTEVEKLAFAERMRGRTPWNRGRRMEPQIREKIAQKKRHSVTLLSPAGVPFTFSSHQCAANFLGLTRSAVSHVARGLRKSCANGWRLA